MVSVLQRLGARSVEGFTGWWARWEHKVGVHVDALYERLGPRYWQPIFSCVVGTSLLMWWSALIVSLFYEPLSVARLFVVCGFVSVCILVAIAWIWRAALRTVAGPIRSWMAAGHPAEGAADAWQAAVDLPFVAVWRMSFWRTVAVVAVPMVLFLRLVLGSPWLWAGSAALAFLAVLPASLALEYFLLEMWMRPVRRDAARRRLPELGMLRPTSSMRWRLLVAVSAIAVGAGVIASLLSAPSHVSLTVVLVDVPIGVGVAALLAFGLSMLLTEFVVRPVDELVGATRGIRAGDLSARVPVQSADELGILTSSFNSMAAELQRGREQMVSAREEERRRLRRDLHDELGPALAALVMQLEVADELLEGDPAAVRRLIGELKAQAQDAIGDVRRVVYELRPPSLDELGLVGAIRENASRLTAAAGSAGPAFTLVAPESLPQLPAAVEVAAFRIAQEALTNLVRHAGASTCTIEIAFNGALELQVSDDGSGIPANHDAGVGLASMRERAVEVGGSFAVERAPVGGTIVRARLPVPGAAREALR